MLSILSDGEFLTIGDVEWRKLASDVTKVLLMLLLILLLLLRDEEILLIIEDDCWDWFKGSFDLLLLSNCISN